MQVRFLVSCVFYFVLRGVFVVLRSVFVDCWLVCDNGVVCIVWMGTCCLCSV